jgi:predicted short-subunit dehydrogenase-like oxidoreductase (DUF2520 family)
VEAVVSRRPKSAKRAARTLPAGALPLSETQLAIMPASQLVVIATPDDVIGAVAGKLAKFQKGMKSGRTVLHTSGALSSEVLQPLAGIGFHLGSLHPLVSVSDAASGATKLSGAYYCLEGDKVALRVAHALVRDLGGHSFSIAGGDKALYHAAAVMASGHMTALFDIAIEMLASCGLSGRRARLILLPLIKSAVANLASQQPARALTGTFARGDLATAQRHLAALSSDRLSDARSVYRLLGKRSLAIAAKNGVDRLTVKRITTLLK